MKKLNLGCGKDYKKDWINLDLGSTTNYGDKIKVDVAHDLNKYPLPFKDDEFDEVYMGGIMEHIKNIDKLMQELRRITIYGARILIINGYFTSYLVWRELNTHKFSLNCSEVFSLFEKNDWLLVGKGFGNNNILLKWTAWLANMNGFTKNFYERFFSGIFPMNQIYWEVTNQK